MVIIMETIKQYKKMWNEISQMFLIGSLSGIAEKKMEQAESKARNEKKRAELEIRKAKKEVKDRTENMKAMEYFWGMGYIMVVLFAILQNGAFQDDFIDVFMTPVMWYVRFCKWLVYPT